MPTCLNTVPSSRRLFFTVAPCASGERGETLIGRTEVLFGAAEQLRRRLPFAVDGWVVLPDHMHCVWTLPPGDSDWLRRWRLLEAAYLRSLPGGAAGAPRRPRFGATLLRQWLLWAVELEDAAAAAAHLAYLRQNPVRHGYVERPEAWPFSTFYAGRARRAPGRRAA